MGVGAGRWADGVAVAVIRMLFAPIRAWIAAVLVLLAAVCAITPALAQQCPNSGSNCTIATGTLFVNTSPNTYSGTTSVSPAASLEIGNGGALNGTGALTNNGTFNVDVGGTGNFGSTANVATVAGVASLTVSGQLNVAGNVSLGLVSGAVGTLTLANGGTLTINSGIGDVLAGTAAGATGTVNIGAPAGQTPVAPGTLAASIVDFGTSTSGIVFNHTSSNYSFFPGIFGNGSVTVYAGTTALWAANSYSGPTTINGGTLEVDGDITATSRVTVNSGGALTGTGTVFPGNTGTIINAGGTLAPGNSTNPTGALVIDHPLTFNAGSYYGIYLTPTQNSLVLAPSKVTINGGTVVLTVASLGASYPAAPVQILGAIGVVTGTFNPTVTYSGAVQLSTTPTLSYDANDVYLNYTNSVAELAAPAGANQNQQNVVNAINSAIVAGDTLPAGIQNLGNLSSASLLNALSQLDGEAATGAEHTAFEMMTQFLGFMLDPFVDGRFGGGITSGGQAIGFAPDEAQFLPPDVALAYASILNRAAPAPFVQRWTAWGTTYGGGNFTNGNATVGSSNVSSQIFGFAGGMDYHYSPDTIVGFALGGSGLNWGLSGGMGAGRSDSFQTGVYGVTRFGAAYLAGSLAFANHWMTTNRNALGDQLSANFDAQSYGVRLEGGYRYGVLPTFGVTPYAALQAQDFHTPAYGEADLTGGGLGLSYASMNATDVRTEIGTRLDSPTMVAGMPVILRGRLAWAHDFVGNPALSAAFETLPGTNFTVNGAAIPHDSALTTAGAELYLTPRWTLLAKFDGEFAPGSQTYGGSGTLRYIW
jgi:autotransporter-associated beta strand protein